MKDAADGTASVIRPAMALAGYTMATDQTSVDNATTSHTNFLAKGREVKTLKGDLMKMYKPKMKFLHLASQAVKDLYGENYANCALWGIDIEEGGEINYSLDKNENMDTLQLLITKHLSYSAGTSPIQLFINSGPYDISVIAADIVPTKNKNNAYIQAMRDRHTLKGDYTNFLKPVIKHLKQYAKIIKGANIMNPARAGDWGYDVIISPKDAHLKDLDFGHLEEITIYKVTNGSDLKNTKTTIMLAFKGLTATGTPITIAAGATMVVPKTWGTMTLKNTSATDNGGITYLGK